MENKNIAKVLSKRLFDIPAKEILILSKSLILESPDTTVVTQGRNEIKPKSYPITYAPAYRENLACPVS